MSKKSQLRLPAELVIWRGRQGNLNVRTEADLRSTRSLITDLPADAMAEVEALYQLQHPEDEVFQAIWQTVPSLDCGEGSRTKLMTITQDDGAQDEVYLKLGSDYPTILLSARRYVPASAGNKQTAPADESDVIEIQARARVQDRFIILTKLEVSTHYAVAGCWVSGHDVGTNSENQSFNPLDDSYTGTPVAYLLSSLHEGIAEGGDRYSFWPGYTVVLDGKPEDDARRASHRIEYFDTPLGQVRITHENDVAVFTFTGFKIDGLQVSASASLYRQAGTSREMDRFAVLALDPSQIFTTGVMTGPDPHARVLGIFTRVAQHVLDTDPNWYGLQLRAKDR